MKFSVVIPTRNRLNLLQYALTSILSQNYDDWEVIVSDNASIEDIGGHVRSLNEPRIKYSRSEKSLSITENWNRSIDLSSGEYVIMIGDDDIFLKNYFQIAHNLIENFKNPDLIYTNAYLYAYPNVIPHFPEGTFQSFGSLYGMPKHEFPFWLDQPYKQSILQATLEFRSLYSTNLQHALISRALIEKVKREGKFFHSPYPDIYAMSALFLEAERLLIYPKELVVIGISSKSHGYYAINKKDKEAVEFLNIKNEMSEILSLKSVLLPGFILYTFWLGANELFKNHFSIKKLNLKLDYAIYRKAQIDYVVDSFLSNKKEFRKQLNELWFLLTTSEKFYVICRISIALQKKIKGFFKLILNSLKKRLNPRKRLPRFLKKPLKFLLKFFEISNFRVSESLAVNVQASSYTPINPPPGHLVASEQPNKFSTILEIYEQIKPIDCSNSKVFENAH